MDEIKKQEVEEAFRKVSSKAIQNSKRRFKDGELHYQKSKEDSEYEDQELIDAAGEDYAFATEIALKSNIIYDDFRKNKRFNQEATKTLHINGRDIECYGINSQEWYRSLAADIRGLKYLGDPKEIKNLILENDSNDERRTLETDPSFNKQFLTLSYDGSRPNGHSLYSYYQLQSGIAKNLINTEYYCYVEDEIKYTIYALLTEDILSTSSSGKTIIPKEMMESIDSVKEKAIELRYASISENNIASKELAFLHDFSKSTIAAGQYRFPLPKKYNQIDFDKYDYNHFKYKGKYFFDKLDKMTKYYLQSCFSNKEIDALTNYVDILSSAKTDISDINIFVNNSIYFKNQIKNEMGINLEFTEKQYGRIDNFCKLIKAFQPFDENSKLLRDNDAFSTEEKRKYYKNEIVQTQKIEKLQAKINKNVLPEYYYFLIDGQHDEAINIEIEYDKQKNSIKEDISNLIGNDKEKALDLIPKVKDIFRYLPEELKNDKDIVLRYLDNRDYLFFEPDKHDDTLSFVSDELRHDSDILKKALAIDPKAIRYVPKELQATLGKEILQKLWRAVDETVNSKILNEEYPDLFSQKYIDEQYNYDMETINKTIEYINKILNINTDITISKNKKESSDKLKRKIDESNQDAFIALQDIRYAAQKEIHKLSDNDKDVTSEENKENQEKENKEMIENKSKEIISTMNNFKKAMDDYYFDCDCGLGDTYDDIHNPWMEYHSKLIDVNKSLQNKEIAIESIRKADNTIVLNDILERLPLKDSKELCMQYIEELDDNINKSWNNINSTDLDNFNLQQIDNHIKMLKKMKELEERKDIIKKHMNSLDKQLDNENKQHKTK